MSSQNVVLNKRVMICITYQKNKLPFNELGKVDFAQSCTVLSQLLLSWYNHATPSSSLSHGHYKTHFQGYSSSCICCVGSPHGSCTGPKTHATLLIDLLGTQYEFLFTGITAVTHSSHIFSKLITLKLFCCKVSGCSIPCIFGLIWFTTSENSNIMFRNRKWSSLPYYCCVVYCHCEFVLQSQAVALKINPLGTWLEPKFIICSKELEKTQQENSCTSEQTYQ